MRLSLAFILFCFSQFGFAGTTMKAFHYKATTNKGDVYDIVFNNTSIRWHGIKGVDKGKSETARIKNTNIAAAIEVIQWKSPLNFNTLIVDHEKLKFVSSGMHKHETWLDRGKLERIIE